MHLGCRSTFGKRKNALACGSSIFTPSESLATSGLVHGSRNPARKRISLIKFPALALGLAETQRSYMVYVKV
jgi:hypothetical protein